MRKLISIFCFFVAGWIVVAIDANATVVQKIQVSGLGRIEEATFFAKLPIVVGDNVDRGKINNALKVLYQTKYFANIQIDIAQNGVLFVVVQENPVVNSIVFGGIPSKFGDAIKEELKLKVRGVYTKAFVKEDAERIRMIFQKTGKLNTIVIPKIEVLDRNRVNVLFDISQGGSSRVEDVFFINNIYLSDTKLKSVLTDRPSSHFLGLFRGKVFEVDSLDVDKTSLLRLYTNRGFADAGINYILAEYEKESRNFDITFDLNEGDVYYFGNLSIISEVEDIKVAGVKENLIRMNEGDLYKNNLINKAVVDINNYFANKGYAFIKIDPVIEKDPVNRVVNVTFVIREAFSVYVGEINILGTKRSFDKTVREELLIKEGDLYSKDKIDASKVRLSLTGYFDVVEIKEKRTKDAGVVDLDVFVRDRRQTGSITFSVGYSTLEGFILSAGVSKSNILGLGYGASINIMLSMWRRTVGLGFNNPKFLGTNLNLGFNITYTNIDPIGGGGVALNYLPPYIQNSVLLALRAGYPITDRLFHSWAFQYRFDDLGIKGDPSSFSNSEIYRDAVTATMMSTSISHTLSYDRRDNGVLPNRGFLISITQTAALPLPNQFQYFSHDFFAAFYFPIFGSERWVLSILMRAGNITSYNSDDPVPYQYRYALGYQNMRGFYFAGVGPHVAFDTWDSSTGQTTTSYMGRVGLRGDNYYVVSFELRMPTPLPKEYGLHLIAFIDIGSSFGISGVPHNGGSGPCQPGEEYCTQTTAGVRREYVVDTALPRIAIGGGILWMSPMAPIRLEFAAAVLQQVYDVPLIVRLHFSAMPI